MTHFDTQLVHGVAIGDNATKAVNPPIYNSSTYAFDTVREYSRWDYARSGNPTREAVEKQIAALEHGTQAFAFSSGLAAIHAAFSIFAPGDHIITGDNIYGGTYSIIHEYFEHWGLEFSEADTTSEESLEEAFAAAEEAGKSVSAIYFEVVTNPLLKVSDVETVVRVAHKHGALVIIDNTFVTPFGQNPLDLGADIVVHSATKYLSGHSDIMAGVAVTQRDDLAQKLYFALNRVGGALSPNDASLLRRGIQTLSLRMERQQENALAVAQWLEKNEFVSHVNYPGLPSNKYHELASQTLKNFGGVLSVEFDERVDAERLLDSLQLFTVAVSLGAVESLAELPCRMTHFELSRQERLKHGITDGLVRLSVGIEDIRDIIADLEQALEKAKIA